VVLDELPTTATGKVLRRVVRDQMMATGPVDDGRTLGQPN
jgi:acyl-coenzyme A synthetase/AMP-(fatty) acid ligase